MFILPSIHATSRVFSCLCRSMKNPEKYLLVVLGCYVTLTITSMISDIFLVPARLVPASLKTRDADHLNQSIVHGSVKLTYGISGNVKLRHEVSGIKDKNSTQAQSLSIMVQYAKDSLIPASGRSNNVTVDAEKRWMALRKNLQDRKVIFLDYQRYPTTEPLFESEDDRIIFHKNAVYKEEVNPVPQERLKGVVSWIPNGTISNSIDCGWKTPLEKFNVTTGSVNKKIHGILCPLLVPDGYAFQHFMDGVLPKLMQAYEFLIPEDVKLLIYAPRDAIIFEMLTTLGFKRSRLVLYQHGTYQADFMIHTCITPPLHPDLWQKARRMLGAPDEPLVPQSQASVILLTRAKQHNPGRKLMNSEEVLHFLLHRYGGNRVVLFKGGYSLAQSIDLFGKAKIIIGVHGGAFYNMMYAPRGTHVIEIMPTGSDGEIPRGLAHGIIWKMAGLLGQPYWRIPIMPLAKSIMTSTNVQLNIAKLKGILDKVDKTFV